MPKVVNRVYNNLGMLDEHRAVIRRNYDMLVAECDIQKLIPKFLEKNIFSIEMIRFHTKSNDIDTKKSFFLSLNKRGPKAFDNFIQSLKETNQHNIAHILCSTVDNDNANGLNVVLRGDEQFDNRPKHAVPCQLPSYAESSVRDIPNLDNLFANVNLGTLPLTVKVKHADRFYDASFEYVYQTHSKCRGAVLIINNRRFINDIEPPRNGAEFDDRNLKHLFEQMNMSVYTYADLRGSEMRAAIEDFAQSPKLKNIDMTFVFIMSHGKKTANGTTVVCTDNAEVETDWIEHQFNNQNCVHMQKKPKILVYQICRGEFADLGAMSKRVETDSAARYQLRTLSDTLVAHSTLPGYSSHRDIFLGSWYIQLICEVFMLRAYDTHIEDLFKLVDLQLERYRSEKMTMQTSSYTSQGFNKKCYLHPGIYREDGALKTFTPM